MHGGVRAVLAMGVPGWHPPLNAVQRSLPIAAAAAVVIEQPPLSRGNTDAAYHNTIATPSTQYWSSCVNLLLHLLFVVCPVPCSAASDASVLSSDKQRQVQQKLLLATDCTTTTEAVDATAD